MFHESYQERAAVWDHEDFLRRQAEEEEELRRQAEEEEEEERRRKWEYFEDGVELDPVLDEYDDPFVDAWDYAHGL